MKKRINKIFLALALTATLTACGAKNAQETLETTNGLRKDPYSQEQFLLGTYTRIRIYDEGKKEALEPAFARIAELDDKITINDPGSEIDAINQNAGIQPVKVSPDVYALIKKAKEYSVESEGAFNLVIGGITQLWRIGFDDARKPSQAEIEEALKTLDYQKVQLDDEQETVYLEEKGMIMDLGAIAKGYIADETAEVLRKEGVTSGIVDLGGNVLVIGHSFRGADQDWKIGIQDPNDARGSIIGSIEESDKTVVTSGIYERYLELDGVKYHHIFDMRTGYPVDNDVASVSIITDHSIDGDALTTLVFAKGIEEGLKFVEEKTPEGTDAIFISLAGEVFVTSGLKDTFELSPDSEYTMAE
ncbi:FAD:protein FMN transferase [Enterococcus sp. LJL98]